MGSMKKTPLLHTEHGGVFLKKIKIILGIILLLGSVQVTAKQPLQLTINGALQQTVHPVEEQDGTACFAIGELLRICDVSATTHWNGADQSLSISTERGFHYFAVGNEYAVIGGHLIKLPQAPYLYQDQVLYVPLVSAAKLLGYVFVKSKSYAQLMHL